MTKKEKKIFIASLIFALLSFVLSWLVMRSEGRIHYVFALIPMALAIGCSQWYMWLKGKRF